MTPKSFLINLLFILIVIAPLNSFAQALQLRNGHDVNGSGEMGVLIVFAELDCTEPCPNAELCGPESSLWPVASN